MCHNTASAAQSSAPLRSCLSCLGTLRACAADWHRLAVSFLAEAGQDEVVRMACTCMLHVRVAAWRHMRRRPARPAARTGSTRRARVHACCAHACAHGATAWRENDAWRPCMPQRCCGMVFSLFFFFKEKCSFRSQNPKKFSGGGAPAPPLNPPLGPRLRLGPTPEPTRMVAATWADSHTLGLASHM